VACQRTPGFAWSNYFELVDLLIQAALLKQRMRLGQALLVRRHAIDSREGAMADDLRFQLALVFDHAENVVPRLLCQQFRVPDFLRVPDGAKFVQHMAAVRIEVIGRAAGAHSEALAYLAIKFTDALDQKLAH